MKKLLLLALLLAPALYAAQKKNLATRPAKVSKNTALSPSNEQALLNGAIEAFDTFKAAVQEGKPKADVQGLWRDLGKKGIAFIHGYTGEIAKTSAEKNKVNAADKALNEQQIKAAEQAWNEAELAVVNAKKANKSADEISALEQAEKDAQQTYNKRKGQYILMGELKDIKQI